MANQIHEELEKWPTISNFLVCTLHLGYMLWSHLPVWKPVTHHLQCSPELAFIISYWM